MKVLVGVAVSYERGTPEDDGLSGDEVVELAGNPKRRDV